MRVSAPITGIGRRLLTCVVSLSLASPAAAFTFTKIADNDTPVPGVSEAFTFLGSPAIQGETVSFTGYFPSGRGVYKSTAGALGVVADTSTAIPGGSGTFIDFGGATSTEGGEVVFEGYGSNAQNGLYAISGTMLAVVADQHTVAPGGPETFQSFNDLPSIGGGTVVFRGLVGGQEALYAASGGSLRVVADSTAQVSGAAGDLLRFSCCNDADGSSIVFRAGDGEMYHGIYLAADGILSVVADVNTRIPGSTGYFTELGLPTISGNEIFFKGEGVGGSGIYFSSDGVLQAFATIETPAPGASGPFTSFGDVSVDAGVVAFFATFAGGSAIYTDATGSLEPLIRLGDMLDGRTIESLSLSAPGLSDGQIAFQARFTDGSFGIFVGTVPEPGTGILVTTGLLALACRRRSRASNARRQ